MKGDSLYFISKENIGAIINHEELKPLSEVKLNDNISFFDKNGNVVYQAICVNIVKDTLVLSCFDLDKKEEYFAKVTINNFENVRDLKKFEIEEIKILP